MHRLNADVILALLALVSGLLIAFVWAPLDSGTGLIERVRGRSSIGDALAPTLVGVVLVLSGALLLSVQHLLTRGETLVAANAIYLMRLLLVVLVAITLMRWAGPTLVALLESYGFLDASYRQLRATPPFTYIGFVLGGSVLVTGLIALIEHKVTLHAVLVGVSASLVIALMIDLPFNNLLLPPNGDV
ncbi:MAG: hypothetical protein AAFY64_07725 [Pseudomonadota bacterium]